MTYSSRSGGVLRVLQVHTMYRQAGGEDQVVEAEKRLLEAGSVAVRQVVFDNADVHESVSLANDLHLAISAVWSRSAERRVADAIRLFQPDVMHVHNTFMAASPSVYVAAHRAGVPIVQTLHNYRFVCPKATTFRDGRSCTDCVGLMVPWPSVAHACVRGSRAQSLVAAAVLTFHRSRGTFHGIAGYIALTESQRRLMVAGGMPSEQIRVVPNFLEPDPGMGVGHREGVLYAGRLSAEKGIATLLRAARMLPRAVKVAGTGPDAAAVQEAGAESNLVYFGALDRSGVTAALRESVAAVLPSIWFEGLPLIVLEAFATGTPVIASRIGSLEELVEDGQTGLLTPPGDAEALVRQITWALAHPSEMERMGRLARKQYETRFRGAAHLDALLDTYRWAVARVASSQ